MLKEKIILELLSKLNYQLSVDQLELLRGTLIEILNDYDISAKKELPEPIHVVPDMYEQFLVAKRIEGMKLSSLKTYNHTLKHFFEETLKPIAYITPDDIRLFLYNKSKTNVTPRYLNHIRSILFSFFDWCQNEGYISRNPVKNINRIKYIPKEIEPLSEKDLEICRLAYLELPYRDQVMFEFFYSTGCRCQEVCELKIKDVNFDTKTVRVIGKGNKPRTVFLNEKATLMLQHYISTRAINSEYLFVTRRKPYTKLSVDAVENVFRALGRKVGFHIHPHMMRHTMATIALSRGMPLEEVQTILGHSSPETTMIYTKVNNSNIQYHHSKFVS